MAEDKENNKNSDNKSGDSTGIHCPKCGGKLRKIGRETVARITGITEYDTYCDKCEQTVSIEDRSTFEQEGKILITFA